MNKLTNLFLSALILAGLLGGFTFSSGMAASSLVPSQSEEEMLTFAQLGENDTLMQGPFSTMRLRFGLPSNWAFEAESNLQLTLTSSLVTNTDSAVLPGQSIGASMLVTLNKKLLATIPLVAGTDVAYNIPISPDALVSISSDGRQDLVISLDARVDCDPATFAQTTVVVSSASFLNFSYIEQSAVADLSLLPRPIYQKDSIRPVNAILVVPDAPSALEMQAAMIVSAGFGRMTDGVQSLTLLTTSQFTEDIRADSNVVFVGASSALPVLQGVILPASLVNGSFSLEGVQPEDGVIQMATSPWNFGRSVLVVSGNSDAGVLKAAKALSTGALQAGENPALAVVAEVNPSNNVDFGSSSDSLPQINQTFADLGYDLITVSGVGLGEIAVEFFISPGLIIGEDSYLDLTFNNSSLADYNNSGISILLNNHIIGDARLSDQTTASITKRIRIPQSVVVPGINQIRIQAYLATPSLCSAVDNNLWLTVMPESLLHLPLVAEPIGNLDLADLSVYPYPFINVPTLSDTAFILSNSPSSWAVASQIASNLGSLAKGTIIDLEVAFDGQIPDEIRDNNDLIIVGLPADLEIINELNGSLPGPFEAGGNSAIIKNQQILYRFSSDLDLGYLELLDAPWDDARAVLAVVGNSEDGVNLAGGVLVDTLLRNRLRGNFALINGVNVTVADTRTGFGLGSLSSESTDSSVVIESTPVVVETTTTTTTAPRLTWIPFVIAVLFVLIIVVLFLAIRTSRNQSRQG